MDTTPATMDLSLDFIMLGVPETGAARTFYRSVFATDPAATEETVTFDAHGTGRFALQPQDKLAAAAGFPPSTSGYRGYVVTYIVSQPTEVEMVMKAAIEAGAEVLKSTKKALFGSFAGVFRAPDGAIWKVTSATNKDTSPAGKPPRPSETTIILGVEKPKSSKAFYQALGMTVDRDYGNKYIDFTPTPGVSRLCLMERGVLARDVRVDKAGSGFSQMILHHRTDSRDQVDLLLVAAAASSGRVAAAATETADGSYTGSFADPDGNLWVVTYGRPRG